jgi:hypothetical protein
MMAFFIITVYMRFKLKSMNKTFLFLPLLVAILLPFTAIKSQTISYPVAANPISVSYDSTVLTVQVAGATANPKVTITLPAGVFYIPGSFAFTNGSGVVVAGGTTAVPVFSITAATNPFTFTIRRRADCAARTYALGSGTFKDIVKVDAVTENAPLLNTYNVKYPTLTLTQPASITNIALGSNITRTFSLRNTGEGCTDTVFLEIDYGSAALLPNGNITADGLSFSPNATLSTASKKVYKIFGTPIMANGLCNGDAAILVSQPVTVTGCTQVATNYKASWGSSGTQICQSGVTTGNLTVLNTIPLLNTVVTANPVIIPFCSGSPYASFTATVTNAGNGPAGNLKLYIANFSGNNFQNQAAMAIDTASVLVNGVHPSGIAVSTAPSWRLVKSAGSPNCSVGLPAQCLINMPANFIVPAAGTLTITWNVYNCNGGQCDDGFAGSFPGIKMEYDNECGSQHTSSNAQTVSYGVYNQITGPVIQLPAQVIAGDCFNYLVDFTASLGPVTGVNSVNRYAELKLTLPVGMSIGNLAGDVKEMLNNIPPHAGYPKQVGQNVYFRFYPSITNSVRFKICTTAGGPPCGITAIPVDISMVNDSSCALANRITSRKCLIKSIEVLCPSVGCALGGVSPRSFGFFRSSYGLPDNNQDGKPDATGTVDLNKIDRDRYRPGDTLHSDYRGVVVDQTAPLSITNWNYILAEWGFGIGTWQAAKATVTIKRGGISYVAAGVPITAIIPNTNFRANWGSATFTPAFPAGGYVAGDSIIVGADFIYLPPQITIGKLTIVADVGYDIPMEVLLIQMVYAAQTVPAAQVVNGSTGFTCSVIKYNGNLLGHQNQINLSGATGSSCNSITTGFTSTTGLLGGSSQKQYFNYEYRPITKTDSIIYIIPAGWVYSNPAASSYFYTTKSGASGNYSSMLTPVITGSSTTGYSLKYDFNAAYSSAAFPILSTEGYYFNESIAFKPGCNTPDTLDISVKEYGHYVSYPNKANPASYINAYTALKAVTYSGSSRPGVIIANNTGVVEAATENDNYWDVQITGANFNAAKYVWLATEKLVGNGIDVLRVEYPIGTALPASSNYGTGKNLYNIGTTAATGLVNPVNVVVRVYFTKTGCGADSMKVRTGWDCSAFATSADNGCSQDMFLKATSSISEIQLLKLTEPAPNETIDVCNDIDYKIKISSTQKGDLDNPVVKVTLPAGMELVGNSFTFQYPDTANAEVFVIAPVGNVFTLNLEDHSLIPATGLKGLVSSVGNADRVAYVSMKLRISSCSFVNGVSPSFQIFGDRPCDGTAVGNTLTVIGNPVVATAQAAVPVFSQLLTIPGSNNITCNTAVTVKAAITSGNGNTFAGDSAVYIFPAPLKYKAGSFVVSAGTISSSTLSDQKLVVRFAAKTANAVTFQFDVISADIGCSFSNYDVTGTLYRSSGYLCPLSFGSCQLAEIKHRDTVRLQMTKPALSTTATTVIQSVLPGSVTIAYDVHIANNGNVAAAAGTYIAKVFCGTNAAGKVLHTFTIGAIAIGAEVIETGSFVVNIPANCTDGNVVFIQVQDTMINGTKACLCSKPDGVIAISGTPLATKLERYTAILQGSYVQFNWVMGNETAVDRYEMERSTDAVNYSSIGLVTAANKRVYNLQDASPKAGLTYYRLKIIDTDGKYLFSTVRTIEIRKTDGIIVYPNPAKDVIHVKLPEGLVNKKVTISLSGMDGKLLYSSKMLAAGQTAIIDVSKLANGKYHILVASDVAVVNKLIEVIGYQ